MILTLKMHIKFDKNWICVALGMFEISLEGFKHLEGLFWQFEHVGSVISIFGHKKWFYHVEKHIKLFSKGFVHLKIINFKVWIDFLKVMELGYCGNGMIMIYDIMDLVM